MTYDVQQALNEIMEITPIYRRDYIVEYLRKNLPKEDAKKHLFSKTKTEYLIKMMREGYITREEVLDKIGRERIEQYFHIMSRMS
jgi:hypothetical protein